MKPDDILQFEGGGSCPVQYELTHKGHEFYIRYRHGWLTIDEDDSNVYQQRLAGAYDGTWSNEHTTVYLFLISEAIRSNTIDRLELPTEEHAPIHAMFVLGPFPRSHIIECEENHEHTLNCYSTETYSPVELAARENGV